MHDKHPHRLSVAPMMDWTDRHERYFLRLISRHVRLYTEMVTTGALLRGDAARHLDFDPAEHPVALQLGGSDPRALAAAARMGAAWGYDEINLNVGCPSDRVSSGRFGACLMAEPALVADGVAAMIAAVPADLPVTVKHRIGIDDLDGDDHLSRFVETVAAAGCRVFIVHARKAWLSGLSPRENREIPPLRPEVARRLKADFPALTIVYNGGVRDLATAADHLRHLDGVMIGRGAYETPWMLAEADRTIFGDHAARPPDPTAVARAMAAYAARRMDEGVPLHAITRHILPLFHGIPGARAWRRHLSERACRPGAGPEVILEALAHVAPTAAVS
ncbi:tRNA dihydrouridine(20/20a) synthase DusA [Roseospira visakhapatnamensis]|uniref:tRNA-dihydrouridine(20/20a) synthase n=1 Tax=Roseospira visakhapatnamensis TaxID=390880 RepID=A0A7W6WA06_9PROT|nr:tRNA dihydrouridine(20/20a) synthase DusA [Roseospira visakhapatnamensis]MBB4265971.1 tRNA-dihydrouridine synthase A [Roseospira visakhapatnamensis]